jgi:hypothetical protein
MNPNLANIINALWYFGPLSARQIRERLLARNVDLSVETIVEALTTEYFTNLKGAKVKPALDQGQPCPSVIAADQVIYKLAYNPLPGAPDGERRYHPEWKEEGNAEAARELARMRVSALYNSYFQIN